MRNGAGRAARGGEGRRPVSPLEGGGWGCLVVGLFWDGTLPGFPSPHLRHFPERMFAACAAVLVASGSREACDGGMRCSFVVLGTRSCGKERGSAGGPRGR